MAYDMVRQQIVLFGGNNSDAPQKRNDTWVWDGTRWLQKSPANKPSQRLLAAMAFDPARGNIVLFGGFDPADPNGGELGDTWIWNGSDWVHQTPSTSPPPRYGAGLAFDPVTQRILLFGGYGDAGELNDTWSWNGTTWNELHPATAPSSRTYVAMSSDPARNGVLLFGGYNFFSGSDLNDTWFWNGTSWKQQLPVTSPPARSFSGLAPDPTGKLILFGGTLALQNRGDTWSWDGGNWTLRASVSSPEARAGLGLAYDSARKQVVLFGGRSGTLLDLTYREDTWTWDGTQWSEIALPVPPPDRSEAGMAYDAKRDEMVLFGGWNGQESLDDTWIWKDRWSQRQPAVSPAERSLHGMAFDEEHSEAVVFGGFSNGARLNDTWIWNGTTWTIRTPLTSPPARYGGAMVYDAARKRVLLFGGSTLGSYQNDTWSWDGTNWTQHTPVTSPPPRYWPGMAYHAASGKVVLFGGFDSSFNLLNDTWTWDGINWTQQNLAQKPSPRYGATLGDSRGSDRLLLFGGSDGGVDIASDFNDTWSWNGTNWSLEQPTVFPDRAFAANMIYETTRQRVLYFGGSSLASAGMRETWAWSTAPALTRAVSAKVHGINNRFDIDLPYLGPPGIECRTGGATNAHRVIITFAAPITYNSAAVTSGTGMISSTAINGKKVTINLRGVANAQNITMTLFGVNDGTNSGDISVSMGMLLGDTNGNRAVNSSDISQTKAQSGHAVTAQNFREDVSANGLINSSDISVVKSKSGTGLP